MRSKTALVCVVALLAFAACGGNGDEKSSSSATTKNTDAITTTTTTVAIGGASFGSQRFVVPFTVKIPDAVKSQPVEESTNVVSWVSTTNPDNKIRFLAPVEIYRPNGSTPEPPPTDFVSFVQGLTEETAEINEVSDTSVGGKPAKLMTISRFEDANRPSGYLDGTLGCPVKGADREDGCFGPQNDLALRLAIVYVDDQLLLLWARGSKSPVDTAWHKTFEQMLSTVQFS
jgi:hypothetical protein